MPSRSVKNMRSRRVRKSLSSRRVRKVRKSRRVRSTKRSSKSRRRRVSRKMRGGVEPDTNNNFDDLSGESLYDNYRHYNYGEDQMIPARTTTIYELANWKEPPLSGVQKMVQEWEEKKNATWQPDGRRKERSKLATGRWPYLT